MAHLPDGYSVDSTDWDDLDDRVTNLENSAITIGGTTGSASLDPNIDSGVKSGTPDSFGNISISFNVTFATVPQVVVTGNSGLPNCLITINNSTITTTGFNIHCQDTSSHSSVTSGTVKANWIAVVPTS